ncbi:unnamed protein product [Rotaria magnacalcarata]|uniref:Amine oxidase domain-containing protein n=2 Tax=Rotaria magnacalcarata TaxID=392030 RepID=A0A815GQ56_9BILA|nr:unnamed protein product [Rotaria magnacalcarata]CAF1453609.1 unnamed protein product [Rotaria magnacalcarata]
MESVKVVIVGGGAAGLGAAKTLGPDVNYLLIEAQDYIGGRIRTVDAAPDAVVDLGAQYIHGKTNNRVFEICKQLDCIMTLSSVNNEETIAIRSDRTRLNPEIVDKVQTVWEEFAKEAQSKFGDITIPTDNSFYDYLVENFKPLFLSALPSCEHLLDEFIDYFDKTESIENGCSSLVKLSLAEYGSYEYLEGLAEYELKNGGYRPFISYLKSFIPDDSRIRLNSEVVRVKYLHDTHQLQVDTRNHNIKSEHEQETSTIVCDHIVWTSSLGYLKENFSSIFADEIELIEQKQDAINRLGFDTINKTVLIYEKRFWPDAVGKIMLLDRQKQKSIEFSDSLKTLIKIEQIDERVVNTIIEAVHRYDELRSTNVPILICWFGGSAAVLIEDINENIIGQICHEVLCYYLNLSSKLNKLNRVLKSEWHKNRFIRGSYSYYSIKSSGKAGQQLRTAYEPDGIPRILFAGEATHENGYSTVHGAFESGIREGNRLLSILNE